MKIKKQIWFLSAFTAILATAGIGYKTYRAKEALNEFESVVNQGQTQLADLIDLYRQRYSLANKLLQTAQSRPLPDTVSHPEAWTLKEDTDFSRFDTFQTVISNHIAETIVLSQNNPKFKSKSNSLEFDKQLKDLEKLERQISDVRKNYMAKAIRTQQLVNHLGGYKHTATLTLFPIERLLIEEQKKSESK